MIEKNLEYNYQYCCARAPLAVVVMLIALIKLFITKLLLLCGYLYDYICCVSLKIFNSSLQH